MVFTLSIHPHEVMAWWVDATYVVHSDKHGHTGGTMSLNTGHVQQAEISILVFNGSRTDWSVQHDAMTHLDR